MVPALLPAGEVEALFFRVVSVFPFVVSTFPFAVDCATEVTVALVTPSMTVDITDDVDPITVVCSSVVSSENGS